MARRSSLIPVLAVGLIALVLRLAYASSTDAPIPVLDQARFLDQAERIRAGQGPEEGPFLTSPLYPYLLALLGSGTRTVQLVLGALTCALVSLTATRRFGPVAGWVGGLAIATFGPALHYEGQLLVAGPMAFLLALALACEPERAGPRALARGGAAGVALGLAAALRPTALVPALALGAVTLLRRQRGAAAALGVGLALAVLPFTLRNALVGEPVLLSAGGGFNLWVGNHEGAPGVFTQPAGYDFDADPAAVALARRESGEELSASAASSWWRGRADIEFGGLAHKTALLAHPEEIPQLGPDDFRPARAGSWLLRSPLDGRWLLVLALLAPLALGRARLREWEGPLVLLTTYGAVVVLFFISGRFRFPMLPVAAVLAGGTVAGWLDAERRARITAGVGALVLGGASLWLYSTATYTLGEGRSELDEARAHAEAGDFVAAEAGFRAVLEKNPADGPAALDLAKLLMGPLLGDTREVMVARASEVSVLLRDAVMRRPDLAEAWYILGIARWNLQQHAQGIEAVEQSLRRGDPDDEWFVDAGNALEAMRSQ